MTPFKTLCLFAILAWGVTARPASKYADGQTCTISAAMCANGIVQHYSNQAGNGMACCTNGYWKGPAILRTIGQATSGTHCVGPDIPQGCTAADDGSQGSGGSSRNGPSWGNGAFPPPNGGSDPRNGPGNAGSCPPGQDACEHPKHKYTPKHPTA
ncbi:hypothetical protein BCV70DRAFT_208722 [Testicularia cyperi]|uniref:Uncharacterized protein n=1 Tax=Testicularia cyperi TaxID=1882483 RepID=A0A317XHJ2_9BASI|nr:hypothetical protein BCV70DRAFT_208722 [Testicularia cyperi]